MSGLKEKSVSCLKFDDRKRIERVGKNVYSWQDRTAEICVHIHSDTSDTVRVS